MGHHAKATPGFRRIEIFFELGSRRLDELYDYDFHMAGLNFRYFRALDLEL